MNNYCTNCGKKIEENELICKNCNTPIIDLNNENNKDKNQNNFFSTILSFIGIGLICVITFVLFTDIINIFNTGIIPNYNNIDDEIENSDDKLNINSNIDNENIYGEDDRFTSVYSLPFESKYYAVKNSFSNDILLEDYNIKLNHYISMTVKSKDFIIDGYIDNPNLYNGKITINALFYDKNFNLIGDCSNIIKLPGKDDRIVNYCIINKNDLKNNNTIYDIIYYKFNILSSEIKD